MNKLFFSLIILSAVSFSACLKKDFDSPPDKTSYDPNLAVTKTIAALLQMGTDNVQITTDEVIYGVVTADDRSGNFYKQIVIQDSTGGVILLLEANNLYNDYPIGRKIYVKCKGLYLGNYNKLPQLGYVPDNTGSLSSIPAGLLGDFIVKANYPNTVTPVTVDLASVTTVNTALLNRLITIDNVEFAANSAGQSYAQPASLSSGTDRTIEDCNSNTMILRTSGYSNFQPFLTPKGKGSITAIYTCYKSTPQLIIRDTSDVKFNSDRCAGSIIPIMKKDFEDNSITSGGWVIKNVTGNVNWVTNSVGANSGKSYGQCTNFSGGSNTACETWLISTSVDLSTSANPVFSFLNAWKYTGPTMEVFISTDYDGTSEPSSATWTKLSPTLSSGNFAWVNSGDISLSAYKNANVRVAFKYTGTGSSGSTWEIDDITIKEN